MRERDETKRKTERKEIKKKRERERTIDSVLLDDRTTLFFPSLFVARCGAQPQQWRTLSQRARRARSSDMLAGGERLRGKLPPTRDSLHPQHFDYLTRKIV